MHCGLKSLVKVGVAGFLLAAIVICGQAPAPVSSLSKHVHYDGADWNVKGDGIVCCPCTVPCPCRTNSPPSYGHCEATLFLRLRQGHYGPVSLDGLQMIDSGGMCAIRYRKLTALYFDRSSTEAQREAFLKLMASFAPTYEAGFPYVRVVPLDVQVIGDHLFKISIPGILQMVVDRNWGQPQPPMPEVAAPDYFSNVIQYAENLRYVIHDAQAGLNFDYSHRQANYRMVDLNVAQYRNHSMLIQFADGAGGFNPKQMKLIEAQGLKVANIAIIRQKARELREARAQ